MNKKTLTYIDKSSWPDGVWKNEPDFVYWVDEGTGYHCFIKRYEHSGHLSGYVVVPKTNFFFENSGDDVYQLNVHGSVTYRDKLKFLGNEEIDLNFANEEDWVIGFDCLQCMDINPRFMEYCHGDQIYRDINYVTSEVESLARQLKVIGEDKTLINMSKQREQLRDQLKIKEQQIEDKISELKDKVQNTVWRSGMIDSGR